MAELLPPGTVVAGYRTDGVLGEGGMGVVYEATQLSLDRKVALKIVATGLSADAAFRARFRREGLIQARVEHPNIVTVYEAGEDKGLLFLAMRLVRGASLNDIMRSGALDAPRTLRILHAVAGALDSAHDAGLIHRDVKPHNILVGARDYPYLADFGITKAVNDTGLTRTGQFMGSLDYMAPEQIRGEQATAACDIYALGAVLFECLTGVVPFASESEAAVLYAHIAEPAPKISEHRPELPEALDEVIASAMAKEPAARPQTAAALIEAAESCFTSGPVAEALETQQPLQEPAPVSIRPAETRAEMITAPDTSRSGAPPAEAQPLVAPPGGPPNSVSALAPSLRPVRKSRAWTGADEQPIPQPDPDEGAAIRQAAAGFRRRARQITLTLAAVAVIAGGYVLGRGSTSAASDSRSLRTLATRAASVEVPPSWRKASSPALPGMNLVDAAAAHDPAGNALAVGELSGAEGKNLLPPAFEAVLEARPHSTDAVKLGAIAAYRYRALRVRGSAQRPTLLVVPTTVGVEAVICIPRSEAFGPQSCEAAAASLRLIGANALPLGPSASYARVLSKAVERIAPAAGREHALAAARTRAGQAHLAATLAGTYQSAASLLVKGKPGPDAATFNSRLLTAIRLAGQEYATMAAAARAGESKRFHQAGMRQLAAQRSIRSAIAQLQSAGYR
jgi:serine/threonine protein kinase